ncbi:MAG: GAF domain-containing protein, partial [Actinomycetota bacterium]|nr:GAF domain-containing protein [Actinomycetota bacterium]
MEVGRGLVANLDVDSLLKQLVEVARELTGARYVALGVLNDRRDALSHFSTTGIDPATYDAIGTLPSGRGVLGFMIDNPQPLRLARVSDHHSSFGFPEHHPPMQTFLGVPVMIRGEAFGNLYLTDKSNEHGGVTEFTDADEAAVVTLATWASIAVENARSVREDRLRATIQAAERERTHWARELHDETLQGLAGLRVMLSSALRRGGEELLEKSARDAVEQLTIDIANLRGMISELRPAALDELGLEAALEGLAGRVAASGDFVIETDLHIRYPNMPRLPIDVSTAMYRLVQESLNNVVKHARASHVWISAVRGGGRLDISVRDDG